MNEPIIIGSITIPYSLSNPERLLWLEDWIYSSSEGLLCQRIAELIFLSADNLDDSMKWIMEDKRWIYLNQNEFYAPNGTIVRFLYDENAEEMLNKIRR